MASHRRSRKLGLGAAAFTLAGAAAFATFTTSASASAGDRHPRPPKPTVVLVHGGFADASNRERGAVPLGEQVPGQGLVEEQEAGAVRPSGQVEHGCQECAPQGTPRPCRPDRRPLAGCRSSRRHGVGPVDTTEEIEAALLEQFGHSRYATAILAELDLLTGALTRVNRGHHPPIVIRNGQWVATLEHPPAHPMGTAMGLPVELYDEQPEPGDRVLLYTDGITEARNPEGEILRPRPVRRLRHPPRGGRPARAGDPAPTHPSVPRVPPRPARDDATLLLQPWHGTGIGTPLTDDHPAFGRHARCAGSDRGEDVHQHQA
ncbi:PP2C family protein-serine/threonine phosphatase [Embleya sp. NPDC127516]|uniref:PP2C family protein-serine/threonine phosphatase n=1 Tax=Embleya sp. NPDC127516 TaxID=3363990 RepID=UPI0037F6F989